MNQPIKTLKGFRDFIGIEARKRLWLIDSIRVVFERFGFEPLETPALEYEELLLGKYGNEADKLIYGFEDRGERRVALRYDQTIPTARVISQYQNQLILPYKRYQIQPVWRADKPQKGRYREFLQCDADIIGSKSFIADAEILAVYASIYKQLGLTSLKIKINDRQSLISILSKTLNTQNSQIILSVIQTIDKLDKKSEEDVVKELIEKGIEEITAKKVIETLNNSNLPESLKKIIEAAANLGIDEGVIQYIPTLARGLDYYTGMIFEGIIPEYSVGSVGGGGRYDNLLKNLVNTDLPAIGFGLGFDRTLEAAEQLGKIPQLDLGAKVLVTVFSPELLKKSLEIASELRKCNISTEVFNEEKSLDKQLKYAAKKNILYAIIIGQNELEKNEIILKEMNTGKQKIGKLNDIVEKIKI